MDQEFKEVLISMHGAVVCDLCNGDFTDSDESGGFLFSNYAYCPKCAIDGEKRIKEYNEEQYITDRCPPDKSFAEFVRDIRKRSGDTKGEGFIRITHWPKGE